mmetsp:Transcript_11653/g.19718  ORF Transcript_11653/g.19718 Transcript_11653/m.19718 type:complete len:234 (+) Transcript_11653:795-1496(+)
MLPSIWVMVFPRPKAFKSNSCSALRVMFCSLKTSSSEACRSSTSYFIFACLALRRSEEFLAFTASDSASSAALSAWTAAPPNSTTLPSMSLTTLLTLSWRVPSSNSFSSMPASSASVIFDLFLASSTAPAIRTKSFSSAASFCSRSRILSSAARSCAPCFATMAVALLAAASATLATSKAFVNCSSNLLTLACSLPSAVSGETMGGFVPSSILRVSLSQLAICRDSRFCSLNA